MTTYLTEHVDRLPFGGEAKARRYATELYQGATGRNWYSADPTLQWLMRRYLSPEGLAWAQPHLEELGALVGGPIAERAEQTDRNPPRLERYDRWGRDVSHVAQPESFEATRRDLMALGYHSDAFEAEARAAGADPAVLQAAWLYLLDQAEIAMACALTTGEPMVLGLAEDFAPPDILARVRATFGAGGSAGEAAQMLTERSGGTDLAALETTATPDGPTSDGGAWRLNGLKWFVSNVAASVWVVLAKAEGGPDDVSGVAPFLVLRERRDGRRNGVRIRQLKDKLGTRGVASGEVELLDAQAFLLSPPDLKPSPGSSSTPGFARMMKLTNAERFNVSMMSLGCARRSLVEAICYANAREAFGRPLVQQPLVRRKLAEMVVEVEAAQALVFDGFLGTSGMAADGGGGAGKTQLRIAAPLIKLRCARLGVNTASDAVEMHGGNGYIETWPVARILRDAQVNTVWEGPDNVLCLDVRRAMEREQAHKPFLHRLREAVAEAPTGLDATAALVTEQIDGLEEVIEKWALLDRSTAEARLFPLAQLMVDVYAGAILLEQAGWDSRTLSGQRKSVVARRYAETHFRDTSRYAQITADPESEVELEILLSGAVDLTAEPHGAA